MQGCNLRSEGTSHPFNHPAMYRILYYQKMEKGNISGEMDHNLSNPTYSTGYRIKLARGLIMERHLLHQEMTEAIGWDRITGMNSQGNPQAAQTHC